MTNRRTMSLSILGAAVFALCLPLVANAQWPDYGRNRDDRNRNGNYGRYDERYLRDSIQRLDRLARDFEKEVDRTLDRSHEDGTRHEDRLNNEVRDFRQAVRDLKSNFSNGRDLNRSRDEAERVLQTAREAQRATRHHFGNGQLADQWSEIQGELRVISDAYGLNGYNDDGYYRNGRNQRDDDSRRRNRNNNDWWRRLPIPR
ncbi:MAG: hypothetical protein ABJB97_03775 [Acidobacteriota bacterium]